VAAVLTMDPWLYLPKDEVLAGSFRLSVPHIAVNSVNYERLTSFDIYAVINKFFENSKSTH
jgi:hypothetical protein